MVLAWVIILDVYIHVATGSFCFLVVLHIFLFSGNSLQHSDTVKIGSLLILSFLLISFDLNNTQWQNRITLVYLGLCNSVWEFMKTLCGRNKFLKTYRELKALSH